MYKYIRSIIYIVFLIFIAPAVSWSDNNMQKTAHTGIRLYTDGKNSVLAEIDIEKGWHIYWSNPGEIGLPTEVKLSHGDLQIINQSAPQVRLAYDIMEEYVYEDKVFYDIHVSQLQNTDMEFSYVECNDTCKSETLRFDLDKLTVSNSKDFDKIKNQAQKTFPQRMKLISPMEQNIVGFHHANPEKIKLIPFLKDVIDTESVKVNYKNKNVEIKWKDVGTQKLSQALIMADNNIYAADIVYTDLTDKSLLYILFLAFAGGIILNAMPCVFPILSLKVFAMLQEKKTSKRGKHAFGYTLGVLFCFWILTTILVVLKKQGEAIGWGFQLQSPWFVGTMAVIFMVLFLFMIDLIHFPNLANGIIHKIAGINSFFTGFFAVLIASPCTGPFMGAAVGYAFMQSSLKIFMVFTLLALGYALPYVLIVLYPRVVNRILPRPGRWMKHLKVILSIPVLLTSLWLFSVLASQIHTKTVGFPEDYLNWQNYDAKEVEKIAQNGGNIFIDFTAKWCLTCQFNDKVFLNSARFKNFVRENNVYLFKADLTEDNDAYDAALSSYGRDGIPVYVYYKNGTYKILPIFFKISEL